MSKISICQINVIAKRPDLNSQKIINFLERSKSNGADVAVFPEMSIPGYLIGDDWEDKAFIHDCISYAQDVRDAAYDLGISVIYGNVSNHSQYNRLSEDGRNAKYNTSEIYRPGCGVIQYKKTNLPNYREFDDKRYFNSGNGSPNRSLINGVLMSTSICEDGWDDDYGSRPIQNAILKTSFPHVHTNLSCSPFTNGKNNARHRRFANYSKDFSALIYVNNVGIQNNGKNVFVFDGSSTVYVGGEVLCSLPPLVECFGIIEVDENGVNSINNQYEETYWNIKDSVDDPKLFEVISYAIKQFCDQSGIKKIIIGLSGGIDSALSAMLHVKALGKDRVITVNMPSNFNSDTTRSIAKTIADNLGCVYLDIPIQNIVDVISDEVYTGLLNGHDELAIEYKEDSENIQARVRGAGIQATLAGGMKACFPNNGNKTETSVGYCTILGDLAGYLAPIADLWKGQVYEACREIELDLGGNILPEQIYSLKPSAELSNDHNVDQGKGDPMVYWYHDKLFASWIEPWNRDNIEDTLRSYSEGKLLERLKLLDKSEEFNYIFPTAKIFIDDLERWWKLFKGIGIVKRVQAPPIVTVSRRSFGFDFREAIGQVHFTREYNKLKEEMYDKV